MFSSHLSQYVRVVSKNVDVVIQKMVTGTNWPREGYLKMDGQTPMTKEEIKAKWENIGEYARNKGTWMHHNIERGSNDALGTSSAASTYDR